MTRRGIALLLCLIVLPLFGQEATEPAERATTLRKLTKRERQARIAKLSPKHEDFVSDVQPIIVPAELDLFLSLEDDAARDGFIDEFWRRRDHTHRTSPGAFREMYYGRLSTARQLFKSVANDRAKIFLLAGPPQTVTRSNCQSLLQPIEIWRYEQLPQLGTDVRLLFYRPKNGGEYKLWNAGGGAMAMSELMVSGDPLTGRSAEEQGPRSQNATSVSTSPYAYIGRIQLECDEGPEIMLAITAMIQNRTSVLRLFEPPQLEGEDAQKILRSMVVANPNAPKLTAEMSVAYPAKEGSRTGVQMTVLVPRDDLSPAQAGGQEVYTIDVTGEVLKDGELWEKYRYRFDYPGDVGLEKLPVVIDRLLRPAAYVSRIKVTDANSGAEALVEQELDVPEIFTPAPVVVAETNSTPAARPIMEEPADPKEARLRIIPPAEEVVSGLATVETILTGSSIKAVEFSLDGRKIAIRRTAPWAVDLDFGEIPQLHRIRAVGLDAKGQVVTGDELTVNTGTDPFRVRIVSPRVAPRLSGRTRVELAVDVPEGEKLASLELFWNETRMATLYDPPFIQTIDIPATDGVGYIRAVATLESSSTPPVEDAVVVNTPSYMEELEVHLVELPTTVSLGGKPVENLTAAAFRVLDEGKPVNVARFDHVRNVPLSIGMAIDASGSMLTRLDEAQKAGAQFFEKIMRKGDKAFLVTFDSKAQLAQRWSPRIADVHAGLARVRAEDMTALYDAVVYSLYNFQGIRGQRALVLISDGRDTASKFTYEQMLEYARRSGVPVYGIGLGIRQKETDVRFKLDRLCRETGGTVYYIDQARELQRVYDDIETELRSQYILGFYPPADAKTGKWREVTVEVKEGKAKTVKGYFP